MSGSFHWDGKYPIDTSKFYCGPTRLKDVPQDTQNPYGKPGAYTAPLYCRSIENYMRGKSCPLKLGDEVYLSGHEDFDCSSVLDIAPDLFSIVARAGVCDVGQHPRTSACKCDEDCDEDKMCEKEKCVCLDENIPCYVRLKEQHGDRISHVRIDSNSIPPRCSSFSSVPSVGSLRTQPPWCGPTQPSRTPHTPYVPPSSSSRPHSMPPRGRTSRTPGGGEGSSAASAWVSGALTALGLCAVSYAMFSSTNSRGFDDPSSAY